MNEFVDFGRTPAQQRLPKAANRLLTACLVAISAFLPALSGRADDSIAELQIRLASGVLRWGGDAEGGAPYQLRDPENPNHIIGFEVDLAEALAEQLGRRIDRPLVAEFVQYEWVSLPLGLERGDYDLIISGFEYTTARVDEFALSRPYYLCRQELAVRQGDDRINTLDDCRDKAVGTLSGSAAERLLTAEGVRDIVGFDGQVEPYLDLELGRLDAVLLDSPIVTFYARPNRQLKILPTDFGEVRYAMALRKNDGLLAAAIDQALGQLIADGQLASILRRWHLWNPEQVRLARGDHARAEMVGLGFDEQGNPRPPPAGGATVTPVDVNLVAASARQWKFADYAPLLVRAAGETILLSLSSMAVAMGLGLLVCVSRLYGPWPIQRLALVYVEFFRGIPLLLLLFFLYFGLASYGVDMTARYTAIVGFGLTYAAYESEIYRSAIQSVPRGQWEAALALGMSPLLAFRRIIFPQALRGALAPMTNDFVALFKDTSLVSVIAVHELTKEYLILSRSSLKFVELGLLTAALYLAMSVPLGYLSRWLEKRWGTSH